MSVDVALLGDSYTLGAEEDHSLFLRAEGGVGDDEADGGLVGVVAGRGEVDAELAWHGAGVSLVQGF